jgi:hypothetical protein
MLLISAHEVYGEFPGGQGATRHVEVDAAGAGAGRRRDLRIPRANRLVRLLYLRYNRDKAPVGGSRLEAG